MMREPFQIESSTSGCCFELTAFCLHDVPNMDKYLPVEPGAVRGDAEGGKHLYFSPGRWLSLCAAASAARPVLPATIAVVDVSGKWHLLRLAGADAERVLRFQLAVDDIFAGRACAAVTIFDCPVVIERHSAAFDVWTHASYSEHLRDALANAHRNLQRAALGGAT